MAEKGRAPVTVAVNGTEGSLRALDWAVDEAHARRRRLRIVYVFNWPVYKSIPTNLSELDVDAFGHGVVKEAERHARERRPDLDVDLAHFIGELGPVLLREAERAEMIVVGSRNRKLVSAVLVGSTGLELAASAACPAVIVPDREEAPPPTGRILVGVDGSECAQAAAEWAFAEAAERGAVLRVVTVHHHPSHGFSLSQKDYAGTDFTEAAAYEEARRLLSESIAGERERYPQVVVEEKVLLGHPAQKLISQAEDADLIVVGTRGRGGFAGMLLGSVSQSVLTHVPRPVAIVHTRKR